MARTIPAGIWEWSDGRAASILHFVVGGRQDMRVLQIMTSNGTAWRILTYCFGITKFLNCHEISLSTTLGDREPTPDPSRISQGKHMLHLTHIHIVVGRKLRSRFSQRAWNDVRSNVRKS
jgi:hypothetical protein